MAAHGDNFAFNAILLYSSETANKVDVLLAMVLSLFAFLFFPAFLLFPLLKKRLRFYYIFGDLNVKTNN
jgi:hypothetical protein